MKRSTAYRTVAAGLLLASAAAIAQAAPVYQIDATTDGGPPDAGLTNVGFSLTYEDTDGNHLFSLPELLAFTPVFNGSNFFEQLIGLPDLAGLVGTGGGEWVFRDSMPDDFGQVLEPDWHAPAGTFTPYTSDPFAGSVPEPGTWALSVLSLAALGFARRHARRPNGSVSR